MNSTNKIDKAKNCFCFSGAIIEEKLILKKNAFFVLPSQMDYGHPKQAHVTCELVWKLFN